MRVEFESEDLQMLDAQTGIHSGCGLQDATTFRRRVQVIRAAPTREALLALRSMEMRRAAQTDDSYVIRISDAIGLHVTINFDGREYLAKVSGFTKYET